ncbi:MAG: PIN domain-containing protein [bacterium]|nr:PIN domain-containing protein [bacterium]
MIKVFFDTDVVISSTISSKGAAHILLSEKKVEKYISTISIKEIHIVAKRLSIGKNNIDSVTKNCKTIKLSDSVPTIKRDFKTYVFDEDDSHIVAGAVSSKSHFLITYNLKDYNRNKIKEDFKIVILTPALFLQYVRSL